MTKVELKLQVGSPAADKHKKKVEEDAADLRESQNKSELILLGVGRYITSQCTVRSPGKMNLSSIYVV